MKDSDSTRTHPNPNPNSSPNPGVEFGWPVDREDFGRVEMGRKPKGTTGYEEEDAEEEE